MDTGQRIAHSATRILEALKTTRYIVLANASKLHTAHDVGLPQRAL